ncbi:glycosyltransferase involved in cell wall biosynthesis [Chitinophaga skermanii]|uniref:Glycosyltransferase involved in cell wall biosynthesis n=1 Tax=Chitinophaga skermanii TaxID=331697 RepID=A0A327QE90_9BACT|nr:glycosyltransferase [Chitinophaga skermanii]RAJ01593.1 glycosyltransferase involved in cell wall biosynthesis [Chitinophaga skermanii]
MSTPNKPNIHPNKGVSVVICCYNSALRLPGTLQHLALQQVPDNFTWEIILVDNASNDDTVEVATGLWNLYDTKNVHFRIVEEPKPGQMYARKLGVQKANYECIVFCDDDNWLSENYVHDAWRLMRRSPQFGAGGGQNLPTTNAANYPSWFEEYKNYYATGIPAAQSGEVTYERGFVLGAGMVTRKSLFTQLTSEKYPTLLPGRNGEELSTGDDFEYCKRLLLWGYKLYYEESMVLMHFIPEERLTVKYRDRLMAGIKEATKVLGEYDLAWIVHNRIKHKNPTRLWLLAPFRILATKLGIGDRKTKEEQMTQAFVSPFEPPDTHLRVFKQLIREGEARKQQFEAENPLPREENPQHAVFKIFSFYNDLVHPDVPKYQARVFKKFGYSVNQMYHKKFSHGDFLNHVCSTVKDTDYLVFFDIDCVPTNSRWLHRLLADLDHPRTLVGAAQTANHLRDAKNLYVSPFFFAISTQYLKDLNYPNMEMTHDMDAGQNLTEVVEKDGGSVKYWFPTHIEEEQWYLHHPEHQKFGPGTTYNDTIYHAFFSRDDLSMRFIDKCEEILAQPA